MNNKKISVIIATKNEEKNILNCIQSIYQQSYKNFEIIVIDNKSLDKTEEISKSTGVEFYALRNSPKIEVINFRGAQINQGVEIALGEFIFIPDADMTIEDGFFEEAVEYMSKYDAVYSPEIIIGTSIFCKSRNHERQFYTGTCLDVPRFFKKSTYKMAGGFDQSNIVFGYDDWDFCKQLKRVTGNIPIMKKNIYHNESMMNLGKYLEKKKMYISDSKRYIEKWGKSDKDILKQFGMYYRYFGVYIEAGKWRKLINSPILSAIMYLNKALVGILYLSMIIKNRHIKR